MVSVRTPRSKRHEAHLPCWVRRIKAHQDPKDLQFKAQASSMPPHPTNAILDVVRMLAHEGSHRDTGSRSTSGLPSTAGKRYV